MNDNGKLIFVYNAKSDKINVLIDFGHKIISPLTYECDLCKLTHSNLGERKEWKRFQKESKIEIEFYHKDEFESLFSTSYKYPVILKNKDLKFSILLDSKDLGKIENVTELIKRITDIKL